MPDQTSAIYIELNVHADHGSSAVYVNSTHVPGLHLMGRCFQSMKPMLEKAIVRLFKDNQKLDVKVIWLKPSTDGFDSDVLKRLAVYSTSAVAQAA